MSTNAVISIAWKSGGVSSILTNNSGGLFWTGIHLKKYYENPLMVKALIELGDISEINELLYPDKNQIHVYENPQPNVTVAFHRDKGEPWEQNMPLEYSTLESFLQTQVIEGDFHYLFIEEEGFWRYRDDKSLVFEELTWKKVIENFRDICLLP